ncbi:MAG: restriction endonuclease subunit S, partial [Candidatus Solibacter sp.]|nr:restriction endonuclease subunit S [Candidatus Solibacter sp.]
GEVPEGWDIMPLKHVASLKGRLGWQGLRADEYTDEGPYLVTSEHFSNERVDWARCYHVSRARYAQAPEIQLRPDDLLMMKDGAAMGKLAYVEFIPGPACLNSHLLLFRPVGGRFLNRFLFYVLGGPSFESYMTQERTGTTFFGISQESIGSFRLALPPVEEQHRILELLNREVTRIDTLIARQERLIELLQEKRQALISHAVTKGLNPSAPMKPSGVEWLGEVPAHWETKPVKLIARIGNGSTPSRDNPGYWEDGNYPWLNSSVVNQEAVTEAQEFVTPLALRECHLPKIVPPAVLMGITGQGRTRGMASTLLFEATINQHVAYLKPYPRQADVGFLRRVFDMSYTLLRSESDGGGSTKGAITCEQIAHLKIPIPPLTEQVAIAAYLDAETTKIDVLVAKVEAAIALMREHRTALISAAVTGKIDVREPAHA